MTETNTTGQKQIELIKDYWKSDLDIEIEVKHKRKKYTVSFRSNTYYTNNARDRHYEPVRDIIIVDNTGNTIDWFNRKVKTPEEVIDWLTANDYKIL